MSNARPSWFKWSIIGVALAALAGFGIFARAQEAAEPAAPNAGFVDDWTHHHLVFSNPGAREDAAKRGKLDQWQKIANDPRYKLQQAKRAFGTRPVVADPDLGFGPGGSGVRNPVPRGFRPPQNILGNGVKKDWSTPLGSGTAGTVTAPIGSLSGNISGSSTLLIDGVTFHASPPTPESATLTISSLPTTTTNATVTVTNGANHFVLSENGAAASTTATFHTLPTATALASVTVGPSTFNLATTATASAYALTLDTTGTTNVGLITYSYTGVSGVTYTITISPSGSTTACSYNSGTHTATGTFLESGSNTTAATNFLSALNTCLGSSDANIATNFTTARATATVTITDVYLGALLTVTSNTLNRVTGTPTAGINGTAATCTGASPYTVDYVVSPNTATMALNLYNELNAAGCTTGDLAVSSQSGSGFTIGGAVLGTGTFTSSNTAVFSFGAASGGSNGSNACTSSTAGTFGTGATTSAVATAISNAINACSAANQAIIGINASSTVTGSGVNIFAYTLGTTGGSGISVAAGSGLSTTGGGALAGGTDGTTSGTNTPPTFAYWSGATYASSATLATNIATAVDTNPTTENVIVASGGSGGVTFSHYEPGTYTVTPGSFSAFNSGNSVTIPAGTSATVQPNAYPAKWGASLATASCANDFVVYPTGQVGGSGAANIIAYNELYYPSCNTGLPATYWAFNTGAGYAVTTSPILSLDGTKVAFIQSNGTNAELVVLKWATGGTPSISSPVTLTSTSNITTCSAPCMTVTALSHNDTYSSPFYDFNGADDTIYVGDDSGYLEKFTGVLNGTAVTAVTPIELNTTTQSPLASPVYDGVSGCVFVGDTAGYLYSVSSGSGGSVGPGTGGPVCTGPPFTLFGHSIVLGGGANEGIFDGPLIDPVAGTVYVFVTDTAANLLTTSPITVYLTITGSNFTVVSGGPLSTGNIADVIYGRDLTGFNGLLSLDVIKNINGTTGTLDWADLYCDFNPCVNIPFTVLTINNIAGGNNYVGQFLTSTITSGSTSAAPVAGEPLGTGGAGYNLYAGTFDNAYYTTGTGNIFVVGNTGSTAGASFYQIPVTDGALQSSSVAASDLTAPGAYPWPSPVTEFYNNITGNDFLLFSANRGTKGACSTAAGNGCVFSYFPTNFTLTGAQNLTNVGANGCWATGGIVIDNADQTTPGASQMYFVSLNGATAGGAGGATPASSNCSAGTGPTILGVQTSQNNP